MMQTLATPNLLTDPGYLWIAPLLSTPPVNTVVGSVFTDAIVAPFIMLGATANGSTFSYATTVEPIRAAEFPDPIEYATTERKGSFAFNLLDYTAANLRRALNGGVGALTATSGSTTTSLFDVEPVDLGSEVRAMLLWESTDATVRLLVRQALNGGEMQSAFTKAPDTAVIPFEFSLEKPSGAQPFKMSFAGVDRGN